MVEALELGTFIPFLFWLISDKHSKSRVQADKALAVVESWAVRRTLLRRTMKNVNKLVVAMLRALDEHPSEMVGDATAEYLLSQTADAGAWPTDDELIRELPLVKVYGNIKQQRLGAIMAGVELGRTPTFAQPAAIWPNMVRNNSMRACLVAESSPFWASFSKFLHLTSWVRLI